MQQRMPQYQPLSRMNFSLLIVRVVAGLIFFMHGYQKLFDDGFATTRDNFDAMGVPLPAIATVLAIMLELVGGLMLISGIYTRIIGFLFSIEMFLAIVIVHFENGFFVGNNGMELSLMLLATSAALVVSGGGQYSTDGVFNPPYSEDWKTLYMNRNRAS